MSTYHRSPRGFTRRGVLYTGGLVTVSVAASGCDLFSTDPESDGPAGDKGPEAPMLAERVEAGDLPPVEERLPVEEDRMVVEPTDRVGVYGGTWRTAVTGGADGPWLHRTIGYEPLMRWNREWTDAIPNVARSIEPNGDASEFTVTLRRGMKWSDGTPLTTEDVLWAYENVISHRDLQPDHPGTLALNGVPAVIEAVDDYTFTVRFDGPKPLFIRDMARQVDGNRLVYHPKHYLEQFHIDFNENADEEAQEEGYDDWIARFNFLGNIYSHQWENPDCPTVNGWICKDPLSEGTEGMFERNPYYFKVDPDGSQLPYLDEVRYEVIPEAETMLLRAQNGEFDFHSRHFNNLENQPVLSEAADGGGFSLVELQSTYSTDMVISFNMNHPDQAKRELAQNREFRIAMSHAINRQELIDAVWQRVGEPGQPAPRPESVYYDEEMATQYTEHDPDLADQMLDDAGFDQRDGDGYRLRPDGERITVAVDVPSDGLISFWVDAMELVAQNWEAVGIRTIVNAIPRENFEARMEPPHEYDANVWVGEGGRGDEVIQPWTYMAAGPAGGAFWARAWSNWYDSRGEGENAQEPPAVVQEQQDLYDQLLVEPDDARRDELFRQILQIAKEQFWCIGTVRSPGVYAVVNDRLHNVGGPMPENSTYNTPAPSNPEQWFVQE